MGKIEYMMDGEKEEKEKRVVHALWREVELEMQWW